MKDLLNALSSSEPEVAQRLIASIDPVKFAEMMEKRDVEDIALMLEAGEDEDLVEIDILDSPNLRAPPVDAKTTEVMKSTFHQVPQMDLDDDVPSPSQPSRLDRGSDGDAAPSESFEPVASPERKGDEIDDFIKKYKDLLSSKDSEGLKKFILETPVPSLDNMSLRMEETFSASDQKSMDKEFNALIPSRE